MKVVLDLSKVSYGTLSMIGQDYEIDSSYSLDTAEGIQNYGDLVVEKLEEDTEGFKKEVIKKVKIDFSKKI